MKYLLFALLAYLAYQFIFNLVIPVYRTSRRIKKGFREMSARMNQSDGHERMQGHEKTHQQQHFASSAPGNKSAKPDSKDYIEFEEIK